MRAVIFVYQKEAESNEMFSVFPRGAILVLRRHTQFIFVLGMSICINYGIIMLTATALHDIYCAAYA